MKNKPPVTTWTRRCNRCGDEFTTTNPRGAYCEPCHNGICVVCGAPFKRIAVFTRETCSRSCASKLVSKRDRPRSALTCKRCGSSFFPGNGHLKMKYCSQECRYLASRKDESTTARNNRRLWRYKHWRRAVLKRDDYTCQRCGATEGLHAHHVKPWEEFPELAFDVDNGLTLCTRCHQIEHGATVTPRGASRLACAECGKPITGRGKTPYCKSCALRLSSKAIASRSNRVRDENGQFA